MSSQLTSVSLQLTSVSQQIRSDGAAPPGGMRQRTQKHTCFTHHEPVSSYQRTRRLPRRTLINRKGDGRVRTECALRQVKAACLVNRWSRHRTCLHGKMHGARSLTTNDARCEAQNANTVATARATSSRVFGKGISETWKWSLFSTETGDSNSLTCKSLWNEMNDNARFHARETS